MPKIKTTLAIIAVLAVGLLLITAPVYAAIKDDIQAGACGAAGQPTCTPAAAENTLNDTIRNLINIFSVVAGIIAVVMIIVAGFRYVTSGGSEQAVAGAKRTFMYALVGLVIVALAQVIARFVLDKVG